MIGILLTLTLIIVLSGIALMGASIIGYWASASWRRHVDRLADQRGSESRVQ